jgi:hypothetical protein
MSIDTSKFDIETRYPDPRFDRAQGRHCRVRRDPPPLVARPLRVGLQEPARAPCGLMLHCGRQLWQAMPAAIAENVMQIGSNDHVRSSAGADPINELILSASVGVAGT